MVANSAFQFRPTIIILDEKAGMTSQSRRSDSRTIYDIFCGLLAHQKESLYQGIGIIHVGEENAAKLLPIRVGGKDFFPPHEQPPANPTFKQVFDIALQAVQNERVRQNISRDGFEIPETRVQIFYVSQTDSKQLPRHMEDLRETLSTGNRWAHLDHVFISYVLIDLNKGIAPQLNTPLFSVDFSIPTQAETEAASATSATLPEIPAPPWLKTLLAKDGHPKTLPLVNFCLIYSELMAESAPTFAFTADLTYAIAEALFALTATPMSLTGIFQRATERSLHILNVDDRIGSLSTSMIRFPRNEVTTYSACLLGSDLFLCLIRSLGHAHIDDADREQKVIDGWERADQILQWISDQELNSRPGTEDLTNLPWPDLSMLAETESGYRYQQRLRNACEAVFRPCRPESFIMTSVDQTTPDQAAILQAVATAGTATEGYNNAVDEAWKYFGRLIRRHFGRSIDNLWLGPGGNVELGRVYIESFEKYLNEISALITKWRDEHEKIYQLRLQKYERIAGEPSAPWNVKLNLSLGQVPQAPTPNSVLLSLIAKRDQLLAEQTHPISLYVAGGVAFPIIYLLALLVFSSSLILSLPLMGLLMLVSGGGIAALTWGYQQWLQRRAKAAELDVFSFLQFYLGYICQDIEDKARAATLQPIVRAVENVSIRLRKIEKYFSARSRSLQEEAQFIEEDLFTGAANYRDVLIANGRQLDRTAYNLQMVYAHIRELQEKQPIEAWHQTLDGMRGKLQEKLLAYTHIVSLAIDQLEDEQLNEDIEDFQSVLALSNEALESIIIEFSTSVNLPYIRGDLANIAPALHNDSDGSLWLDALSKTRTLYPAYIQTLAHLFGAGLTANRQAIPQRVKPPELIEVNTVSSEWLLVARFWPGGGHSYWFNDATEDEEGKYQ